MRKFLDRKRINKLKHYYRTGEQVKIEIRTTTEGKEVVEESATIKKVDDTGGIHLYMRGGAEVILLLSKNETILLDSEYTHTKNI